VVVVAVVGASSHIVFARLLSETNANKSLVDEKNINLSPIRVVYTSSMPARSVVLAQCRCGIRRRVEFGQSMDILLCSFTCTE